MTIEFIVKAALKEGMTTFRFFHHENRTARTKEIPADRILEEIVGMREWRVMAVSMGANHYTDQEDGRYAYFHPKRCDITFRFPDETLLVAELRT